MTTVIRHIKHLWIALPTLVTIVLLSSAQSAAQTSSAPPETDTQIWNDVQVAVPLGEQVDFFITGTLRLGRDVTRPVDERAGFGFSIKTGKYLTFAPAYTYIATQPYEGRKGYESRLSFPVTVRFPLGKFSISDRNLFERRLINSRADTTRYRNRLQVEHGVGPKKLALKWFASDEVFYDWGADAWVRNRFTIGAGKGFGKHLTGELYYMRQNDGRSRPGDLNVIGTTLRFRL